MPAPSEVGDAAISIELIFGCGDPAGLLPHDQRRRRPDEVGWADWRQIEMGVNAGGAVQTAGMALMALIAVQTRPQ